MRLQFYIAAAMLAFLAWGGPLHADAVEGLRQELRRPADDLVRRGANIKHWLGQLQSVTELGEALTLPEWRDLDADDAVATADRASRALVFHEFQQAVRTVFAGGEPLRQVAVADLLGKLVVTARGVGSHDSLGRAFGPDLARLAGAKDPRVRVAAALALGRTNPDPQIAGPALANLLREADPSQRLAATQALAELVQGVAELTARSQSATGVRATRQDVVRLGVVVAPLAGRALADAKPAARQLGAQVLGQAAAALGKLLLAPDLAEASPGAPGSARRGDAEDSGRSRDAARQRLRDEWREIHPVLLALKEQMPALTNAAAERDAEVRRQARQALEEIAGLRVCWLRRVPARRDQPAGEDPNSPVVLCASGEPDDPLLEGFCAALPQLTAALATADILGRRGALSILETMGPAATPALKALALAAEDPDRFVRWAAVRTLGKVGPDPTGAAVVALARRLIDTDLDVRLAAAAALERHGPDAQPVRPALIQTLGRPDAPEMRLAVLRVLERMDGPGQEEAIPALVIALGDPDARVRQTAARLLGRQGPAARPAAEALRRAQGDPDPGVQKAASDALLRIVPPSGPR